MSEGATPQMDITPERWRQIKDLLAEAILLPAEDRPQYLVKVCGCDSALRAELESLIDAHEIAESGFLEKSPQWATSDAALTAGTKIGEYAVMAFIDAGGMGKVYRARDPRLGRDVAIKILPTFLKNDPERLWRFEQEAQAAAALNHPNILAVYQMGTYEGAPYLVSELLEGTTLREQMKRGPLPSRKAIEYGAQIAHGLAAAHEKGIIHRDLKPENLFVMKDGRIKILDFGLAKLTNPQQRPELGVPPAPGTEPGMVMGTVGYMSPEQVRGERADHRADIFALGAILYEMLSGRRAFQEPTAADTLTAILQKDPPTMSQLVSALPLALRKIVDRCMKKDPDRRFQSASDLAFALDSLSGARDSEVEQESTESRPNLKGVKREDESRRTSSSATAIDTVAASAHRWRVLAITLAVLLVAGLAGRWFTSRRTPQPKPPIALVPEKPMTTNPAENAITGAAISPDQKYLAYCDNTGTYLRLLATGEVHPVLPGTKSAENLSWFPDSTHLLASWPTSGHKLGLWDFSIFGGVPRQLSDEGWSASVSPNGSQIVFLKSPVRWGSGAEIWVMDSNGGNERKIISRQESFAFSSPVWAPDGRRIAYEKFRFNPYKLEAGVEIFNLDKNQTTVVFQDSLLDLGLSWLPNGHLVYARAETEARTNSNLWNVSIDNRTGQVTGIARRITNGDGYAEQTSLTADGRQLVFNRSKLQDDVYIAKFFPSGPRIGTPRRLTLDDADDAPFDWTPDSRAVLFISNRTGVDHIFLQAIDRTSAEMLVFSPGSKTNARFSPDRSQIIYILRSKSRSRPGRPVQEPSDPTTQLVRVPIGGGPPRKILGRPFINNFQCSRALTNICVFSRLEQKDELILSRFDYLTGNVSQLATLNESGGHWSWSLSPDGKSLAFVKFSTDDGRIRLVGVSTGSSREIQVKHWNSLKSIDWAADGKALFVSSEPAGGRSTLLHVDLSGNAHRLWESRDHLRAIPSRDGKYLAILAATRESNVWMIENF